LLKKEQAKKKSRTMARGKTAIGRVAEKEDVYRGGDFAKHFTGFGERGRGAQETLEKWQWEGKD